MVGGLLDSGYGIQKYIYCFYGPKPTAPAMPDPVPVPNQFLFQNELQSQPRNIQDPMASHHHMSPQHPMQNQIRLMVETDLANSRFSYYALMALKSSGDKSAIRIRK